MHLFHKWSKWGEVESEVWSVANTVYGYVLEKSERMVTRRFQTRTCSVCGMTERRELPKEW